MRLRSGFVGIVVICAVGLGGCASKHSIAPAPVVAQPATFETLTTMQLGDEITASSFITSATGWAVGTTNRGGGLVARTDDGGRSWLALRRDPESFPLVAVDFIDGRRGWAVSSSGTLVGAIHSTSDGGRTWIEQGAGYGPLESVVFTDALHGTVRGWDGDSPQHRITLRTRDGGASWTR